MASAASYGTFSSLPMSSIVEGHQIPVQLRDVRETWNRSAPSPLSNVRCFLSSCFNIPIMN